jgi:hypothetical protein
VFFETIGPLVEVTGYITTVLGLLLHLISIELALVFLIVSILFGILLSVGAVLLEDITARRYPSMRDVVRLMWSAVVENLGFRQLLTIWRTEGLLDALRGKTGWGSMHHRGFRAG